MLANKSRPQAIRAIPALAKVVGCTEVEAAFFIRELWKLGFDVTPIEPVPEPERLPVTIAPGETARVGFDADGQPVVERFL